ncbi:MAG: LysR family transcriptional regulator [Pseudomonadota bacterium]
MDRMTALQVFRAVAELGSFAAAARQLGLSPAAVSKNIGELEAKTGTRLINRTTRRMALTEAGQIYLDHVVRGLDALADADQALDSANAEPVGTLRVSAPLTVGLTRLTKAIPAFLAQYPGLKLELHLDDGRIDIIRDGYDLAIRGSNALEDSSMIARKLAVMKHVLCASPAYFSTHGKPTAPQDLQQHQCIRRLSSTGRADVWEFHKGQQTVSVTVNDRYAVTSSLAVLDAMRAGFGLSLVPYPYVAQDLELGILTSALDDWDTFDTTLYAVYPSRELLAPKIRVFLDFVMREFQQT